jgi:hypothetical protein
MRLPLWRRSDNADTDIVPPPAHVEGLSPELVLIDPQLGIEARAQLPNPGETPALSQHDPVVALADERAAALERILALSDAGDF